MSGIRKPDYRLSVKQRYEDKPGSVIGVAWKSDKGHISISLNTGVAISWKDDLLITLFPIDDGPRPKRASNPDPKDDGLPF